MNNNYLAAYLLLAGATCTTKLQRLLRHAARLQHQEIRFIVRCRVHLANQSFLKDMRIAPITIAVADIAFSQEERALFRELTNLPPDQAPSITTHAFNALFLLRSLKLQHPGCTVVGVTDVWHPELGRVLSGVAGIDSVIKRDDIDENSITNLFAFAAINHRMATMETIVEPP